MKHTPSPWITNGENSMGYAVICEGPVVGWTVALAVPGPVRGTGKDQMEVNARLISAAPELLEACKWALCAERSWPDNMQHPELIKYLKKAIAKAEGREK